MSELVKTLCCGHKRYVPEEDVQDGQYQPYQSGNYIECPDCGEYSGLYKHNKAAVKGLQLEQLKQANNFDREAEESDDKRLKSW